MYRLSCRIVVAATLTGFASAPILAGAAPVQPADAAPSTTVTVTPSAGTPHTSFGLSFRLPEATGTFGSILRRDTLFVTGPRGGGCVSGMSTALRPAPQGRRLRPSLNPQRLGGAWCAGEFHGRIVEQEVPRCGLGPAQVCPEFLLAPQTIARFRFRVAPAIHP